MSPDIQVRWKKAQTLHQGKQFEASIKACKNALAAFLPQRKHPDYQLTLARLYHLMAANYSPFGLGNFKLLFEYSDKAYTAIQKTQDTHYKGDILYQAATSYFYQRQHWKSKPIYKEVIRLARMNKDKELEINTNAKLGAIYLDQSLFTESLAYAEKSVRLVQSMPHASDFIQGQVYFSLGYFYTEINEFKLSNQYLKKALTFWTKPSLASTQAVRIISTYQMVSDNYLSLQQPEEARNYYDLSLRKTKNNLNDGLRYGSLARLLTLENNLPEAIEVLKKGLVSLKKLYGKENTASVELYRLLGNAYTGAGNFELALRAFQQALVLANSQFSSLDIRQNPRFKGSIHQIQQIKALHEKGNTFLTWYLKTQELKHLKDARKVFKLTLEQIKEWKHSEEDEYNLTSFIKNSAKIFTRSINVLSLLYEATQDPKYLTEAFDVMEQSKAYILLRSLQQTNQSRQDTTNSLEKNLKEGLKTIHLALAAEQGKKKSNPALINRYKDDIFNLKTRQDSLRNALKKHAPEYYKTRYQFQIASAQNIQTQVLKPQEALIEYVLNNDQLFVFTVTFQKLSLKKIALPKSFRNKIIAFRKSITAKDFTRYTQLAQELYQILVADLPIPVSTQKLRIIPSDILYYLPWETLLTDKVSSTAKGYRDLPYLLKKYVISYDYSATLMLSKTQQKTLFGKANLLAFSPSFNPQSAFNNQEITRDQLSPLKGANAEVIALNKLYAGQFFLGQDATEQSFRKYLKNGSVIHLATHAIVDDERPAYSRLLFSLSSQDTLNDGSLHAYELYNLKLNAELVTLSACNTGFGKIQSGEGVMSLGRAFAYAGSPNVLMSLWSVPDQSTSQIMITFYENLANGMPKDFALQKAKLAYIESADNITTNPFYWSSFVLIGDPKPLSLQPVLPFYQKSLLWWLIGMLVIGGGVWVVSRKF
ncbi:hypothetical protein BKI52_23810 [marine bacterium AO1-C]|nr:hypothetical protein BKI52_23810 [marine bacterium AO1-C]